MAAEDDYKNNPLLSSEFQIYLQVIRARTILLTMAFRNLECYIAALKAWLCQTCLNNKLNSRTWDLDPTNEVILSRLKFNLFSSTLMKPVCVYFRRFPLNELLV